MTTQLIATGLFMLVLIGSFDSLESMTTKMGNFEVPHFDAEYSEEYLCDPNEQSEIDDLLEDLDKSYA